MTAALREGREEIASPVELMDDTRVQQEDSDVAIHQMQRMERQVAILERAASGILGGVIGSRGTALPSQELVSQQNA